MNELKELVAIAHSGRIGKIETLSTFLNGKDNLFFKFYKGVHDGKFSSDADARLALYGEKVSGSKFKMLKKRLLERLYTTILFLEPSQQRGSQAYLDTFYYCYKNFVVARLLMGISAKRTGVKLMDKVMRKAQGYHLYDIVQQCALMLRRDSMEAGEMNKFMHYQKQFTQAHAIIAAEARSEELNHRILIHFTRSFANQPKLVELAAEFMNEIEALRSRYNTYQLNYNYFTIRSIYYQLINNFEMALVVSKEYEDYLLKYKQFYTTVRHANLRLMQLNCHLQLRNFTEGRQYAEEALQFYKPGSDNWFTLNEQYFLICLNQRDYAKSSEIYLAITEHPRFSNIKAHHSEVWRVYGGYLYFLLNYEGDAKLISLTFPEHMPFRLAKLLNEIPIFSKDKKGSNVAVLILQILISPQKGAFVDIISRTDALKHYAYKFLSREEAYRSHIFIRMLLVVERSGFDPEITRQKTKTLLARLKEKNINYNATQTRIEIIPYEELWEMVLKLLEKHS